MGFDRASDKRLQLDDGFEKCSSTYRVNVPVINFYKLPDEAAGTMCQALFNEVLELYQNEALEKDPDWVFAKRLFDGYLGYVRRAELKPSVRRAELKPIDAVFSSSHQVIVARSFLYQKADLKISDPMPISLGTQLEIEKWQEQRGTNYGILSDGRAVVAHHIGALEERPTDFVKIAESLIGTPYLWGGNSAFGIDCSGLVQLAGQVCGQAFLRDSDMQEARCGTVIEDEFSIQNLQRGDLIFWQGHVGIMQSKDMLLHANGHTMDVALEPIDEAISRIEYLYGLPTAVRRF